MLKLLVIFIIGVLLFGGLKFGVGGFGTGNGKEAGQQAVASIDEEKEKPPDQEEVIIRVEETKIYLGTEECADIEDLKNRITESATEGKKYTFEHEYAIKKTYDEVKKTLAFLEETLKISINYKE